jgi:UDP-N-acetylmuramate--alanine ligase
MLGVKKDTKIHFIGIGGIGMSGIAQILLNQGYLISGSDINESDSVLYLRKKGASIYIGHEASNVKNVDIVVYSSAITDKNPEYANARFLGLPIIKRAEMLAELMRLKYGIAVAGTHGKTTTTSILATILDFAKLDPTHIIGGIVKNFATNAQSGSGELLIAEADESDGTFLLLNPIMSVITNIDWDHMDHYGTRENLKNAFSNFINKIPFYGRVAININDVNLKSIISDIKKPYVTFGEKYSDEKIDYEIIDMEVEKDGISFSIIYKETKYKNFKINMFGDHNALNATGAIAIAHQYGLNMDVIRDGLESFKGVARRLEKIGHINNCPIFDDYGHHPTEIAATLKALKRRYKKIKVVFEPHRYTRTRDCWKEFLHCFNDGDEVLFLPIYAASESPINGISSEALLRDINSIHPTKVKITTYESLKSSVGNIKEGCVVILGAGPISRKSRKIFND